VTTKHILIPLDGSALSQSILPHVQRLFGPSECHVVLLRVGQPLAGLSGAPPRPVALGWTGPMYERARDIRYAQHPIYSNQLEDGQRAMFEQDLEPTRCSLEQAGYSVSAIVRFGDPADEIVDVAQQQHVDLIAMATHGETGLRRVMIGSVAEQVLSRVSIPILLQRPF
jgi:nucleotide-binding universal stress UspA family protein